MAHETELDGQLALITGGGRGIDATSPEWRKWDELIIKLRDSGIARPADDVQS
ncbi:MAG: hypothetical protein R2867_10280 [Caldilineaceae bacterium]